MTRKQAEGKLESIASISWPGCFYVDLAKTDGRFRKDNPKCYVCDGHKTSCEKYIEKSTVRG